MQAIPRPTVQLIAQYRTIQSVRMRCMHSQLMSSSGVRIKTDTCCIISTLHHAKSGQDRTIGKHYEAVLDGVIEQDEGIIELPLGIDIYDRPRQIVCYEYGKSALTRFCVMERGNNTCLLYTSPSPRDGLLSRMPSSA